MTIETMTAGSRAITTSLISDFVEVFEWMWGDGETSNLSIFNYLFDFCASAAARAAAARAFIIPIT